MRKLAAPASASSAPKPFTVASDGLSLNAAVGCGLQSYVDAVRNIDKLLAHSGLFSGVPNSSTPFPSTQLLNVLRSLRIFR